MKHTLTALFAITRLHNCIAAGLAALLGAYLSGGVPALKSWTSVLAAVTVALVVAVGNVVNDLRDVDVDRIQKGGRPLPSGRLTPRFARRFAAVLALAALALGVTLGTGLAVIVVCAMGLGIAYSIYLKSTVLVGNAAVAALSATIIVFGALSAEDLTAEAGLAAGMVFTFLFAREILKDIADRDGDRASSVTTVATRLGRPASLRIFTLAILVFAGTAILPWILGIASIRYMAAMSLLGLLPALAVAIAVNVRPGDGTVTAALRITKLAWYGGLAAMVLLR